MLQGKQISSDTVFEPQKLEEDAFLVSTEKALPYDFQYILELPILKVAALNSMILCMQCKLSSFYVPCLS